MKKHSWKDKHTKNIQVYHLNEFTFFIPSLCSDKHRAAHLALNKPFCPATTATPKHKITTVITKKLFKVSMFDLQYSQPMNSTHSIHTTWWHYLNWYTIRCRMGASDWLTDTSFMWTGPLFYLSQSIFLQEFPPLYNEPLGVIALE